MSDVMTLKMSNDEGMCDLETQSGRESKIYWVVQRAQHSVFAS